MVEIRVPYVRYPRVQILFDEPSHAMQCFKDDCDINFILACNPDVTQAQHVNNRTEATYGDFTSVADYQDALDRVMEADEQFAALPSNIRERFNHSPEQFLDFFNNPSNINEMIDLGLARRCEPETAPDVSTPAQSGDPA